MKTVLVFDTFLAQHYSFTFELDEGKWVRVLQKKLNDLQLELNVVFVIFIQAAKKSGESHLKYCEISTHLNHLSADWPCNMCTTIPTSAVKIAKNSIKWLDIVVESNCGKDTREIIWILCSMETIAFKHFFFRTVINELGKYENWNIFFCVD